MKMKTFAQIGMFAVIVLITVVSAECRAEEIDIKKARKEAAQKKRRVIYNNDGGYVEYPFNTPEKFVGVRLQQTIDSQVDTVFFNVGCTTIFTFDNDVGETFGEFINEQSKTWPQHMKKGIEVLRKTGTAPPALPSNTAIGNGIEFFLSLRMNDFHDSFMPWMLSRWKRENPQYLLGQKSLNYELPEVRDYIYRILESFCTRFNIAGIELDLCRVPRAFPPSVEGKAVEPRHVEIMNDFMRRIRKMTERVGKQRSRPLLITARTPMTVERSLAVGLDLRTWFEEDLFDVLVVGGGYAPVTIVSSLREIAKLAHRYGVLHH